MSANCCSEKISDEVIQMDILEHAMMLFFLRIVTSPHHRDFGISRSEWLEYT
jgi:hypothetical protein